MAGIPSDTILGLSLDADRIAVLAEEGRTELLSD
jgi:hypothetical protein